MFGVGEVVALLYRVEALVFAGGYLEHLDLASPSPHQYVVSTVVDAVVFDLVGV